MIFCAVASSGCGSSPSSKGLIGSYMVMISDATHTTPDSDLLTVTQGSGGDLLLIFEPGITTDPKGPNANGLRAQQTSATKLTLAAQPAYVDHSTGLLEGTISGDGTIGSDGSCDFALHFVPTGGTLVELKVTGGRL
jgi:hypothetical protein